MYLNRPCNLFFIFSDTKTKEVSQKIEQPLAGLGGAINPDGSVGHYVNMVKEG